MKKVCLLTDHHICINPRVWKEALFYRKIGLSVTILTAWKSEIFLKKDREILRGSGVEYKSYLNLIDGNISGIRQKYLRFRKRFAAEWVRLGMESPWAISHAPELMVGSALDEQADLYVAHLEFAFYAGRELVAAGKKVAFDFEDWYSRDYLLPTRPVKLLTELEAFALERGAYCTATSSAMAKALKETYKTSREITVIYNGFPEKENQQDLTTRTNSNGDLPRLIWFSRNIGPDRGIEHLFEALDKLETPVELHLLGMSRPEYLKDLKTLFPSKKGHKLVIHDFIEHHRLISFLSGFDIGLALEISESESRKVTITNKMLQYLQAGLKIIATDTDGQKEAAEFFPENIQLVSSKNTVDWAEGISRLLYQQTQSENIHKRFTEIFSWEVQEKKLFRLIQKNLLHVSYSTESA